MNEDFELKSQSGHLENKSSDSESDISSPSIANTSQPRIISTILDPKKSSDDVVNEMKVLFDDFVTEKSFRFVPNILTQICNP